MVEEVRFWKRTTILMFLLLIASVVYSLLNQDTRYYEGKYQELNSIKNIFMPAAPEYQQINKGEQ